MLQAVVVILLILWFLGVIGEFTFGGVIHLLLVVALVALVLSLAESGTAGRKTRFNLRASPGLSLAGIWFIFTGLLGLFAFTFEGQALLMAVLALVAGVLLLVGR